MGNRIAPNIQENLLNNINLAANENNDENQNENGNENENLPKIKKIISIKNPVYLQKPTLNLEQDVSEKSKYYIKFKYDATVNFDCYINFNVKINEKRPLTQNKENDNYEFCYSPSEKLNSCTISKKNLEKGKNIEFFEKDAKIDLNYYFENQYIPEDENEKSLYHDVAIEFVPKLENNDNEIIFVSLCNFQLHENNLYTISCDSQKLKTHGRWIILSEIFNSSTDGLCSVCFDEKRNTIFLPCKHACTCNLCALELKKKFQPCPICKNIINDLIILSTDKKNRSESIFNRDSRLTEGDKNIINDNNENNNNENIENNNNENIENNKIENNNNENIENNNIENKNNEKNNNENNDENEIVNDNPNDVLIPVDDKKE